MGGGGRCEGMHIVLSVLIHVHAHYCYYTNTIKIILPYLYYINTIHFDFIVIVTNKKEFYVVEKVTD